MIAIRRASSLPELTTCSAGSSEWSRVGDAVFDLGTLSLKIRIHDDSIAIDDPLRAHLQRRLDYALSGIAERVQQVVVRMSNTVPLRSSPLYRCDIDITLRPRTLKVADTGANCSIAVTNASDRLVRAVNRALERERAWLDGEHPPLANRPRRGG